MNSRPAGEPSPAGNLSAPESTPVSKRWTILALLATAELLGMSLWFTASAVAPQLQALWGLETGQASWLTTVVLLGFVAGTATAAVLNLADVLPARHYFAVSAVTAAIANASVAVSPGYGIALALRFLTGFFLAGVYPPAMKMVATWFRHSRGLAIGTLVGALTVGKAMPYLLHAMQGADYRFVIWSASAGALLSAVLITLWYHDGPEPFARRAFSWGLVGTVLRHRPTRLAIAGYLGHMWELYAMWTAISLFAHAFLASHGYSDSGAAALGSLTSFAAIAAGGVGSVIAGAWADRLGRENIASAAMLVSGSCALIAGWLTSAPIGLVIALVLIWGFAVVADSAQFSALVTEVSPQHAVGTALTLQTSLGFLLSAFTIWLVVEMSGRFGWGPAFSALAAGPALGIVAMARLKSEKAHAT
ncbi:MAG: MFS transporter [Longimicrobiales bacterium]